jgi:hypothetical protein
MTKLKLIGIDGNAFVIIGSARRMMKRAKMEEETIDKFTKEATSGDYDHLLQTVMEYFEVE